MSDPSETAYATESPSRETRGCSSGFAVVTRLHSFPVVVSLAQISGLPDRGDENTNRLASAENRSAKRPGIDAPGSTDESLVSCSKGALGSVTLCPQK